MKTYLAYKTQIKGFTDVSETVKTVEKIAASSVHSLKQEVSHLGIYTAEIKKTLARLSLFYENKGHPLLQKSNRKTKTLILITGNSGLVGGLWHRLVNAFLEQEQLYQSIIVIGARGERYLKEENARIITSFTHILDTPQEQDIERITDYVFDEFQKKTFSNIDILYPKFVSLVRQEPMFTSFLPFQFTKKKSTELVVGLPIFEPSKKKVFDKLLHTYIRLFFYRILMETRLSEFAARTVAMEHAAAKTDKFIRAYTLTYAKERRRVLTQKQLESFAVHKTV